MALLGVVGMQDIDIETIWWEIEESLFFSTLLINRSTFVVNLKLSAT